MANIDINGSDTTNTTDNPQSNNQTNYQQQYSGQIQGPSSSNSLNNSPIGGSKETINNFNNSSLYQNATPYTSSTNSNGLSPLAIGFIVLLLVAAIFASFIINKTNKLQRTKH